VLQNPFSGKKPHHHVFFSSVYGFYFNDLMTDPFLKVDNSKIKTQGSGLRAQGLGLRAQGTGHRAQGTGCGA
jgi:hypothetical protein